VDRDFSFERDFVLFYFTISLYVYQFYRGRLENGSINTLRQFAQYYIGLEKAGF